MKRRMSVKAVMEFNTMLLREVSEQDRYSIRLILQNLGIWSWMQKERWFNNTTCIKKCLKAVAQDNPPGGCKAVVSLMWQKAGSADDLIVVIGHDQRQGTVETLKKLAK